MTSWRKCKQTSAQRGYGSAWRRARARFLQDHPLCVMCLAEGKLTPATVVDHIKPHRGDQTLFWDVSNWQPLCKEHHDSTKKIIEAGGRPPATFDDDGKVRWSR
nr:MAG TPA: HNH endonuclease [Caudoviricetes sp.]